MSAKIIPFNLNFHQQPLEQVGAQGLRSLVDAEVEPPLQAKSNIGTSAPQTYSQSSGLEALATEAGEQ